MLNCVVNAQTVQTEQFLSSKKTVTVLLFFLKEFFETWKLLSFFHVFLNTKIKFRIWTQSVSVLEYELSCILKYEFKLRYDTFHISSLTLVGFWVGHSLVEITWKIHHDPLILWYLGMFLIAFDNNQWPVYPDNYGGNNNLAEFRLLQAINTPFLLL